MAHMIERGLRGGAFHGVGGEGGGHGASYFAGGVQTTELSLSTKQIDIMPRAQIDAKDAAFARVARGDERIFAEGCPPWRLRPAGSRA